MSLSAAEHREFGALSQRFRLRTPPPPPPLPSLKAVLVASGVGVTVWLGSFAVMIFGAPPWARPVSVALAGVALLVLAGGLVVGRLTHASGLGTPGYDRGRPPSPARRPPRVRPWA